MTEDASLADELSAIFARMSGLLISEENLRTALDLVVSLAQETLAGTVGAGVTLVRDHHKVTAAASDELVGRADALQYEMDEGPCLAAVRTGETIRIDDMQTDDRWPRWTAAVQPLGMRSSLSTPLLARAHALGAMKVYSRRIANYGEHDVTVLQLFATQAGILLANVQSYEDSQRVSEQLREALLSRDVIGQAKGIMMARHGLDEQRAFAHLVRLSQESHLKLRELARRIALSVTSEKT